VIKELERLVALQHLDSEIRHLKADLEAIPQRRAEIEREFEQRAFEFRTIENRRDEANKLRGQLEKELAATRARAERAERNLMASKNEKDYTAAIREIDAARKQISQLETQILEQMEAIEQAESEIKEREPEIARLRAELEEKLHSFEEQTRQQAARLEARQRERGELAASLPRNVIALYERISARVRDGLAVVEARDGSCTACFMTLRPQVMAEVRRGDEIILCDNCSRILYYAPENAQKSESKVAC
jgi:predicted  nucleic acid-binding Zn-ribbon protein